MLETTEEARTRGAAKRGAAGHGSALETIVISLAVANSHTNKRRCAEYLRDYCEIGMAFAQTAIVAFEAHRDVDSKKRRHELMNAVNQLFFPPVWID